MEERDVKIKYTIIDSSDDELEGIVSHDDRFDKDSFNMNIIHSMPEQNEEGKFMKFFEEFGEDQTAEALIWLTITLALVVIIFCVVYLIKLQS